MFRTTKPIELGDFSAKNLGDGDVYRYLIYLAIEEDIHDLGYSLIPIDGQLRAVIYSKIKNLKAELYFSDRCSYIVEQECGNKNKIDRVLSQNSVAVTYTKESKTDITWVYINHNENIVNKNISDDELEVPLLIIARYHTSIDSVERIEARVVGIYSSISNAIYNDLCNMAKPYINNVAKCKDNMTTMPQIKDSILDNIKQVCIRKDWERLHLFDYVIYINSVYAEIDCIPLTKDNIDSYINSYKINY